MAKETTRSKFEHYSDRDIDTIASSLPDFVPAADMDIGSELNERAEHYFTLKQWQDQPPPSKQRDELEAIAKAAGRVLKKLEVFDGDLASEQTTDVLRNRLRAAADRAAEAEGGYPDLPPRFFEIDGQKYPDYRGDEAFAASVLGIKRIAYWSKSAAKFLAPEVQKSNRERHAADKALEVLVFQLANLYESLTGRQPSVSRPTDGGEPGGPWLRFLNACLLPLGLNLSAHALDARWRRVKRARDDANKWDASRLLEEPDD